MVVEAIFTCSGGLEHALSGCFHEVRKSTCDRDELARRRVETRERPKASHETARVCRRRVFRKEKTARSLSAPCFDPILEAPRLRHVDDTRVCQRCSFARRDGRSDDRVRA
jgi:hypothetical protein